MRDRYCLHLSARKPSLQQPASRTLCTHYLCSQHPCWQGCSCYCTHLRSEFRYAMNIRASLSVTALAKRFSPSSPATRPCTPRQDNNRHLIQTWVADAALSALTRKPLHHLPAPRILVRFPCAKPLCACLNEAGRNLFIQISLNQSKWEREMSLLAPFVC